jgi:hypothetical protein
MRRKVLWVTAVLLIFLFALAARSEHRSRRAAANHLAIEAALRHFSQALPPGTTREQVKNVLRAQGVAFMQRCCFEPNSPFSILVRVGQEETPWYCSEWPDYVAFEFSTSEGPHRATDILDSDVLKLVHLTSNGEGCL